MSGDHNQYQKDKSYLDQQDSLCPKCGLLSWSGHRCAAILEGEEHMNPQPKALRLAKRIEQYNAGVHSQAIIEDYCKSAAELRRLHEVNQDLLEVLKQFSECDLNENNCATLDVATKRIRSVARAAIAKATGDKTAWQGLTDEEIWEAERIATIRHQRHKYSIRGQQITPADNPQWHHARAIEAKLKEKNT